jgi:hypothetical protein
MEVNKSFALPSCYPEAYLTAGTVGTRIGEKLVANRKVPSLANNRTPVVQFVAIHCID